MSIGVRETTAEDFIGFASSIDLCATGSKDSEG